MKQPSIKIFGKQYKVLQIEFNKEGLIQKIVYQVAENVTKSVFRSNKMINDCLKTERTIQKPTEHPYHGYIHAPDLESLLC